VSCERPGRAYEPKEVDASAAGPRAGAGARMAARASDGGAIPLERDRRSARASGAVAAVGMMAAEGIDGVGCENRRRSCGIAASAASCRASQGGVTATYSSENPAVRKGVLRARPPPDREVRREIRKSPAVPRSATRVYLAIRAAPRASMRASMRSLPAFLAALCSMRLPGAKSRVARRARRVSRDGLSDIVVPRRPVQGRMARRWGARWSVNRRPELRVPRD
jgi:hypothetical protein